MDVTYSVGPRFIDGVNIDIDSDSTVHVKATERSIADPVTVTGLGGVGYEPGQKNLDGSEL